MSAAETPAREPGAAAPGPGPTPGRARGSSASATGGVTRVGLISDTHGRLDPRALLALEREEPLAAIVHAGDIGTDPQVLYELGAIAPVTAVLGNCDSALPGFELPGLATLTVAGKHIAVIHDFHDLGPIPGSIDVVVRGHSHIPGVLWQGSVLVANPGSASQRRSQPSCSVAVLELVADGVPDVRIVWLDELGARER